MYNKFLLSIYICVTSTQVKKHGDTFTSHNVSWCPLAGTISKVLIFWPLSPENNFDCYSISLSFSIDAHSISMCFILRFPDESKHLNTFSWFHWPFGCYEVSVMVSCPFLKNWIVCLFLVLYFSIYSR